MVEYFSSLNPLLVGVSFLFSAVVLLSFFLLDKLQVISILKKNINHLAQSVGELQQQTKLIVKNDMELKLYQEEVEDKLNKLTLLRNLILSSVYILDKEKLFSQINEKTINDLGFKKGLILNFDDLKIETNIGFQSQEIEVIRHFLTANKKALISTPMLSGDLEICKNLSSQFQNFLIASVNGRENIHAIFILSTLFSPIVIRRAEKEIFSIICIYLGQCLDNIKLFEDLYLAKDELEKKIKGRTNELIKSLREVEVVSKAKTDFISSVSHELRTPLTSIKGFSSLLVEEKFGKLPLEAKKRLQKVDENVDKLVDMVNILLDISRIESGKTEIKIALSDVVKLIKDVGDFLSPQMQTKEIRFNVDTPENLNVYMDRNLIERVFINLINNSLKFTPPGGAITIKCNIQNSQAIIAVSDTGCGITKEDLEKVFQEFYRTQTTQKIQGSGLGLSLVKRIIDTHKEKIWVESEPGKETTFYFTLRLGEHA